MAYKPRELECGRCGRRWFSRNPQSRFCSARCALTTSITKYCLVCGAAVKVKRSHAGTTGSYCSRSCMAHGYQQRLRGAANPNYRHGRSGTIEEARRLAKHWREHNKAKVALRNRVAKARRRNAEGTYTAADLKRIMLRQRGKCSFCRARLKDGAIHLDHIIPLVLGGTHWPSNLQFLCAPCNTSKKGQRPEDYARKRGLLL